jgi:hypothetical protein
MISLEQVTFRIDPNRVRDHNRISTRLTHATTPIVLIPEPGEWVRTLDDEGNTIEAIVESVDDRRVFLKLDWDTFRAKIPEPFPALRFGTVHPEPLDNESLRSSLGCPLTVANV